MNGLEDGCSDLIDVAAGRFAVGEDFAVPADDDIVRNTTHVKAIPDLDVVSGQECLVPVHVMVVQERAPLLVGHAGRE
jgi:hypothetical protein